MRLLPFCFLYLWSIYGTYAQTMDWRSIPKEVDGPIYSLCVYDGKLIAGGSFKIAGSSTLTNIAAWDGENWTSLASGIPGLSSYVNEIKVWNNELYVCGNFEFAGTTPAKNIAKWNGTVWTGFGNQFNGEINSICFFKNELYVGGSFDSVGGGYAKHIAKWNGSNWNALTNNFNGSYIVSLYQFNNELFVLGDFDSMGIIRSSNIARWDGLNWNVVSDGLFYPSYNMIEYKSNLLIASRYKDGLNQFASVIEWNNQDLSVFKNQEIVPIRTLSVINNQLYGTGGGVLKWDSSSLKWDQLGTGLTNLLKSNNTYTLCEYKGALYCGGGFSKAENYAYNFIAKYTDITGINEYKKHQLQVSFSPMPFQNEFTIDIQSPSVSNPLQFSVYDVLGKKVYSSLILNSKTNIEDFSHKGIFYWSIMDKTQNLKTGKLITE